MSENEGEDRLPSLRGDEFSSADTPTPGTEVETNVMKTFSLNNDSDSSELTGEEYEDDVRRRQDSVDLAAVQGNFAAGGASFLQSFGQASLDSKDDTSEGEEEMDGSEGKQGLGKRKKQDSSNSSVPSEEKEEKEKGGGSVAGTGRRRGVKNRPTFTDAQSK